MVITLYKGKNKPDSQKQANRSQAKLRGPGERANAQLKAGASSASSAAAPTRPATWSRPSPSYRTTAPLSPTEDEMSSWIRQVYTISRMFANAFGSQLWFGHLHDRLTIRTLPKPSRLVSVSRNLRECSRIISSRGLA